MLCLKKIYKENANLLSNRENSVIIDSSNFFKEPHSLEASFNNYRFDYNIYTAGETLKAGEEAFFVIELIEPKPIAKIQIQFRYPNYPKNFKLQGFVDGAWKTILNVENCTDFSSSTDIYSFNYKGNEKFDKLKFVASNFNGQNRLLMGHFSIIEKFTDESLAKMWNKHLNEDIVKFIGEKIITDYTYNRNKCNMNKYLITKLSRKIEHETKNFWKISRPIIDSLTNGEVVFNFQEFK